MRYLSVCSGIEAASVWADLGWQCAGVAEIEPFPCQILGQRLGATRPRYMPDPDAEGLNAKEAKQRRAAIKSMDGRHMPWGNQLVNFGDFTQIKADDVGPIDLLVGGTPCQSFSIAGKRLGLDDPRGNLTLEFLALAKRLRARWICWENVPGVLSHDEGRTFGTFLGFLGECGFERWAYRVLDAQYVRVGKFPWAVPQRRRRVFVIGYSGAARIHPRAVLFDRESLRGDPAPRRETGQRAASFVGGGPQGGSVSGTVSTKWAKGSGGPAGDECYNMVAHALRGEGFDASEDGTGRGTPLVPVQQPFSIMPMNSGKDYKARPTDVAQPLMSGSSVGGNQGGDLVALASRWGVRRLTPRECERLQGFDDDWTAIEWRGKPADQCPDGPRYKACGNSMPRNVMQWLGERIDTVERAA